MQKIITVFLFSVLIIVASILQINRGSNYFKESSNNILQKRSIVAERGYIWDRNGNLLAGSQPGYRLLINLKQALDANTLAEALFYVSKNTDSSLEELQERVAEAEKSGMEEFVLLNRVRTDKVLSLQADLSKFRYLVLEVEPIRYYPGREAFSHILGFIGEVSKEEFGSGNFQNYLLGEYVGKEGLEKQYENLLRGVNGLEIVEINAKGETQKVLTKRDPEKGKDINLTLDFNLQKYVFSLLESSLNSGAIVVSDVKTGALLSAVNYPSYDNNLLIEGNNDQIVELFNDNNKPLFNRLISGLYPPGSTFKIVISSAALAEKIINSQTKLEAPGSIAYGSFSYKDWNSAGHGNVDVIKALARSADTFFYQIGGGYKNMVGLGVEKIGSWSRKFGFGSLTGIDLPNESAGLVPTPSWKESEIGEPWYIGNTYHLSIGQGYLLATPLQVNYMTNMIASGGEIYTPHLVKSASAHKGFLDIDRNLLDIVAQGMEQACSPGGTAYPLFEYSGIIACKTGTSETGLNDKTHAWLTMFFPINDPEYSITVFLENGGAGSDDAAPIAKKIYQYLILNGY